MDLGSSYLHIVSTVDVKEVITQCYRLIALISSHTQKLSVGSSQNYEVRAATALRKMQRATIKKMEKLSQTLQILDLPEEDDNPFKQHMYRIMQEDNIIRESNDLWKHITEIPRATPPREKRQIGVLFGLLGMGAGIYNGFQVQLLHDQVDNLGANQKIIVKELELHRKNINALKGAVKNIYTATTDLIKRMKLTNAANLIEETVQNMEFATLIASNEIDELIAGLVSLINNKLHPNFIDMTMVKAELQGLSQVLGERNMRLFNKHSAAIYHYPISTFRQGDELKYMIHVPISTHLEQLQIFEFIPTPFHLGNFTAIIQTTNNILIIDDHNTFYAEKPRDFLQSCLRSERTYHCDHSNMYSKDIKESCLAKLYTHDLTDLEQTCDVQVTENQEIIQQLTANRFRILSEKPTQIGITCKGGISETPYKMVVHGNQTLDLNGTCEVTTNHHVFTSSIELFHQATLVNLSTNLADTILEPETLDLGLDKLLDILNKTRLSPNQRVPLKEFKAAIREHKSSVAYNIRKYIIEIIVVLIASLLLILFISYYGKPIYVAMKRGRYNCLRGKARVPRNPERTIELTPLRPTAPPPQNRSIPETISLTRLRQATGR